MAVVSGVLSERRASMSDLPRLEIDTRIDPRIGEVRNQIYQKADEREDIKRREHYRIVAVEHAFEAEQAETVERKNRLDQERTGEERVHESAGETRDHD